MNYNINEVLLDEEVVQGQWSKLIDSSHSKWLGSGISMPERIGQKEKLIMKPRSVVLYEKEMF